jgi:hypothetical protein
MSSYVVKARGIVTSVTPTPVKRTTTKVRRTPRVTVRPIAAAKRRLGRAQLRAFQDWEDGRPETELCFKFYRQATDKIAGISHSTAVFLHKFF